MIDTFKYNGSITKTYEYHHYDQSLSANIISSQTCTIPMTNVDVTAYAFSNVDTFGAQVLCWKADNRALSTQIINTLKTNLELWTQLSTTITTDAAMVSKKGWISVNSRSLTKE